MTELTSPVLIHGDPDNQRLLGDHVAVPGHHTALPGHHTALPGHHVHAPHTAIPVQAAAVPVIVGSVPVVQSYVVPQAAPVKHSRSPLKSLIALTLLALSAILIGLLAYQAHTFFGGVLLFANNSTDGFLGDDNNDGRLDGRNLVGGVGAIDGRNLGQNEGEYDGNSYGYPGQRFLDNVGFNGAGAGMFFFGLLFAVLQAVTALTMWMHLACYMPYLRHSSVMGPLKITAAVGFIALGFACRHINLGARDDTSERHHRITEAIEAFIIINWFFVILALILSLISAKVFWDCENIEEHRIRRRETAAYTQVFLAIVLIGLLAAYFQWFTERWVNISGSTEMLLTFGIMFAVLQLISGIAMVQQTGYGAPGQMPETIHALLKVVVAFGIIAFGFACRSIYLTTHSLYPASAHLVAIQAFVIINFLVTLYFSYASSHGVLNWDNYNTTIGERAKGFIFGVIHLIASIILFGLLAGLLQGLTANERDSTQSINAAGKYMVWFGLLFAVLEFFAGCTMLESSTRKLGGLNPSSVSVTNKVTLAIGALAFGFACRHINLHERRERNGFEEGPREPLVHAIEAFIILNFLFTWVVDWLCVRGKIEW